LVNKVTTLQEQTVKNSGPW